MNLKIFLENEYKKNATKEFIKTDPIQFVYKFNKKEDQEIAGFISAMLAFGSRKAFIPKLKEIFNIIKNPYEFITQVEYNDLDMFNNFVYRHFNSNNLKDFIIYLSYIYKQENGFEEIIKKDNDIYVSLVKLRSIFLDLSKDKTSINHFGNAKKNSACKKLNMFFRWMIRKDQVDLGLWQIEKSKLFIPLDIHVLKNSFNLNLTKKKTASFTVVKEITEKLKEFDENDPIKYDFALFGMTALN